eukprot:66116_1
MGSYDFLSSDWTAFLATSLDASVSQGKKPKESARQRRKKASHLNPQAPPCESSNKKKEKKVTKKIKEVAHMKKPQRKTNNGGDKRLPGLPGFEPPYDVNPCASPYEGGREKKETTTQKNKVKVMRKPQRKTRTDRDKRLPGLPDFEPSVDLNACLPSSDLNPKVPQWERKVDKGHKEEVPSSIENLSVLCPDTLVYYEDLVKLCTKCRELPATNEEKECLIDDGIVEHLPIDDYEGEILHSISKNRVTIIHGETGCGKSTKIPLMLLKNGGGTAPYNVRMFISQPRRIAAQGLMERVRSFR